MNTTQEYAIGVDLGGTKVLAALVHKSGQMVHQIKKETLVGKGAQVVIDRVCSAIDELIQESAIDIEMIEGVGIAAAGVIDSRKNIVRTAKNLGWKDVKIGSIISDRFSLPVKISNDANAAAIAEWIWGIGAGKQHFIYITVSTGIGAGIIHNGRLITGIGDSAGEFGHISIDADGPICPCGNRGCLENYTSGTAIAQIARAKLQNGEKSMYFKNDPTQNNREREPLQPYDWLTSEHVGEAVRAKDPFSIQIHEQVGTDLGVGVTNLIHLFNPEMIAFGGGVMKSGDVILTKVRETVQARSIPAMYNQVSLEHSMISTESGVIGAAGLFFSY